jgi:hypothetical protein
MTSWFEFCGISTRNWSTSLVDVSPFQSYKNQICVCWLPGRVQVSPQPNFDEKSILFGFRSVSQSQTEILPILVPKFSDFFKRWHDSEELLQYFSIPFGQIDCASKSGHTSSCAPPGLTRIGSNLSRPMYGSFNISVWHWATTMRFERIDFPTQIRVYGLGIRHESLSFKGEFKKIDWFWLSQTPYILPYISGSKKGIFEFLTSLALHVFIRFLWDQSESTINTNPSCYTYFVSTGTWFLRYQIFENFETSGLVSTFSRSPSVPI